MSASMASRMKSVRASSDFSKASICAGMPSGSFTSTGLPHIFGLPMGRVVSDIRESVKGRSFRIFVIDTPATLTDIHYKSNGDTQMTVKQWPPRQMPPGYRSSQDCTREIEERDRLLATGWHYSFEPSAEEVGYTSRTFYGGAKLVVREVPGSLDVRPASWTLFHQIAEDGSICLPVKVGAPAFGWEIESGNTEFNKWVRSRVALLTMTGTPGV